MEISIVRPVYNEEENVVPLAGELAGAVRGFEACEVLFVDDGSQDRTWAMIEEQAASHSVIRSVRMPRNSGQSVAMLTGLRAVTGPTRLVSHIDNLMKGQEGNTLQNMNLMCGLPENCGLMQSPRYPRFFLAYYTLVA